MRVDCARTPYKRTNPDQTIITDGEFARDESQIESVKTLGLKEIQHRGERTIEDLLRNIPLTNANGVPLSNNAVNPTRGASSISLRGMDPGHTLVLINRRRVAPYPLGAGAGFTQPFVDLYSIPLAGIAKIELLAGGSTAIWGANAVAGTVNLAFRQQYRGAEASVEYGNTLDKDSSEFSTAVLFGVGNEDTNVSGFVDYYHRNSIFNRDRAYSSRPPFLSTNSSPFNLQLSNAVVLAAGVDPAMLPDPRPIIFGTPPNNTNGLADPNTYIYASGYPRAAFGLLPGFNFNAFSGSFPEQERWGGYTAFSHKVCDEQLQIYGDFYYANVKTHNELAPAATNNFQTEGQRTIAIPPNSSFPLGPGGVQITPPDTPTAAEVGLPVGAFNPFNPFQQIISGGTRGRLADFGNRVFRNQTDNFFATIGIKGRLVDDTWGYDAGFRYSEVKNTETRNDVSFSRFNRILNAADPIFDPASSEFIGTTIPYNPFGDFRVPIPSNAPTIAFATVHAREVDISKLATIDLNIYTTQLFKLPAGGIGFAFGGQFRRETLSQKPDNQALERDLIGKPVRFLDRFGLLPITSPDPFTNAGRKVFALYAETDVPIFSSENAIVGFHALEVKIAGRFEEWTNNDTNAAVPELGLRWEPFDDSFTIRVNWQEGFRELSLQELYQSPQEAIIPSSFFQPPSLFTVASNPDLQPEKSRSFTAGFTYKPRLLPGLTLSADVFDVEITGRVNTNPDPGELVNRYISGQLLPGDIVILDPSGFVSGLQTIFRNEGREQARGIDIGLEYVVSTSFGKFTWRTQATYLDSFRLAENAEDRLKELSNQASSDFSNEGYIKWRARSELGWSRNGFDVTGTVRYTDGFREKILNFTNFGTPGKFHWVDATWFFDVQASYELSFVTPIESQPVAGYSKGANEVTRGKDGKAVETDQTANYSMPCWKHLLNNTTITVGCNNVFGRDPPDAIGFLFANAINYPGFLYDATGRLVYARVAKKF